ncbi:hypothetical protein HK102_001885 [Quaeritorhiza haematococci]|nr:hypothetical protein HK102_001885 [Quaeritorhiza haematococci]
MFAKKYLSQNRVVFPVGLKYDEKKSRDRGYSCKILDPPPPQGWQQLTMDSVPQSFRLNSLGLVLGPVSGVLAVDIDNMDLWKVVLDTLGETEPLTCRSISQRGAVHLLFKVTPALEAVRRKGVFNMKPLGYNDFDILRQGDFLLVPPSSFETPEGSREYKFVEGYSLLGNSDKLMDAPDWLIEVLTRGSAAYHRVRGSYIKQVMANGVKAETSDRKKRKGADTSTPVKRARSTSVSSDEGLTAAEETLIALDLQDRIKEVAKHVKKLDANRAINRQSWIKVGMAIHHATDSSPEGMELWDQFSQQVGPYDRAVLEYQWDLFKNGSGKEDTKAARDEKKRKKIEEEKMKAEEALRRECRVKEGSSKLECSKSPTLESLHEAVKFGVNHTGGEGVLQNWDADNFAAIIKNTMHHPDHQVKCLIGSNGAFQQCTECEWRNPFVGQLMVPQSEYPVLHQQFYNITINNTIHYNNNAGSRGSEPIITIPKLEVFEDPDLNKWVWKAIHYCFKDDPVARIIHHFYQGQWVYNNQTWYVFQDHRWQPIPGDDKTESFPSTDVITLEVAGVLETVKNAYVDNERSNSIIKRIDGGIRRLKESSGISSIITPCRGLFKKDGFAKGLDQNDDLLGFTNGVYDLAKDEFRAGQPEDMVSMTVGYAYEPMDEDSEAVQVVHAWLDQVFPVAEEKHFVLKLLASAIHGQLLDEKFWIWIGGGANGKSTLINLMERTLGDYATNVSSTLFTYKSAASNAPTPQLVELVGKRFVSSQEIQRNEHLNLEMCKKLTGGDPIKGRGLYQNTTVFTNKSKIMFCLNNLPTIRAQDEGIWRRIVLIKFRSSFVNKPKGPYEFRIDRKLKHRMGSWKPALMAILLQYYRLYVDEGLEEVPKCFCEQTDTYRCDNDELGDFIEAHCELGDGFQLEQDAFVDAYTLNLAPRNLRPGFRLS